LNCLKQQLQQDGSILSGRRFVTINTTRRQYSNLQAELVNIHSAFHQGQFEQVVDFDTSSFSSANNLPAQVLKLRARLALGQYDGIISELKGGPADLAAVKIAAEYLKAPSEDSKAVSKAQELAKKEGDNLNVQLLCGTVLAGAGLVEEALALLSKHQGSLDAYVALETDVGGGTDG
jgi:coatomer protein complex subunit epsilon